MLEGETAALDANERQGSFVHELRNHLNTAILAFALVGAARVSPNGATGAIVDRSLGALGELIERRIVDTRAGVAGLQRDADRSGIGLGLSISRKYVETCNGTLTRRNIPGEGCVFTIDVPRHRFEPSQPLIALRRMRPRRRAQPAMRCNC